MFREMSAETVTTWTCQRCGTQEEVPGVGQPQTWTAVYFARPPRSSEKELQLTLCDPCDSALRDFLHRSPEPQP